MLMVKLDHMQQSVLQLQIESAKQREEQVHMTVGLNNMQHSFLELQTELAKHREEAAQSQNDSQPHMQHCFLELQSEWAKHREEAARSQNNSDKSLVDIKRAVQNNFDSMRRLEDDVGRNFTLLQERSWQIFALQATHTTMKTNLLSYVPYRSCSDIGNAQSGAYIIQTNGASNPFMAYCQRDVKGGDSWLVIQHRFDGSLNFYRNWKEYRDGFGNIENEFWIGLERLHQLTSGRPHELMVELRDFKGNYKFAVYAAFEIGSEAEQYNLKTLGAYHGTAGDSLSYNKNMKFTTYDRDNDEYSSEHCAVISEGAWWYKSCSHSYLNGPYKNIDGNSMIWYHFSNSHERLSFSRMMIRPK
ncbi:fibrinogen-like protein A [Anopheles cruzii]|uniref:fibrinogen-like protein A n=1 Tax=Anopheles cruzii TaxID=68878 RepID=UPI0022EC9089|nr:fibrinogen-like protein A [Anopheles cruzii]XP_052871125.1 fibrinogen-like protein A [Anopheles cruzii]